MKEVKSDISIVPNYIGTPDEYKGPGQYKDMLTACKECTGLQSSTGMVEIDHTGSNIPKRYKYLPLELFKGKKEGDNVSFEAKECKYIFTLKQKESIYKNLGAFEECLKIILTKSLTKRV